MVSRKEKMAQALALAEASGHEKDHTEQVRRLALILFDLLEGLHGLGGKEREDLELAAVLHDIGWGSGGKEHHKTARDIILGEQDLLFDNDEERMLVALVARYHKGALPQEKHGHFAALTAPAKEKVEKLSAVLRIADGLDRSHTSIVRDVTSEVKKDVLVLRIKARGVSTQDDAGAMEKADLFEKVFRKKIELVWGT